MTLDQVLALARKHLGGDMESSARLCLRDAVSLRDEGDFTHAYARAVDSLAYSVGVFNVARKEGRAKSDAATIQRF